MDIHSYEKVELTDEHDLEDEFGNYCGDDKDHLFIAQPSDFLKQLGGLKQGRCYVSAGHEEYFGLGGWYSVLRDALSQDAIGVSTELVQEQPDKYFHTPFYELVSVPYECFFGPAVAKKLAKDFRIQREVVVPRLEAREPYLAEVYNQVEKAFQLASEKGMVWLVG